MKALVSPDLEHYAARHTTPEPELLAELRAATQATMDLPQMQVGLVVRWRTAGQERRVAGLGRNGQISAYPATGLLTTLEMF